MPSVERVEQKLYEMFPSGYPVLCSSGRSALFLALCQSKAARKDLVGVFPFASHCVIDAISRVATPLAGTFSVSADLRIAYHQWGYVQEFSLPKNTIEDCVDTLCKPGAKLFPGGGSLEIWSLPKILGTTSGGVLWCSDEKTADSIRVLRDARGGSLFQWLLRLLAKNKLGLYNYWEGAECESGKPSRLQTGEILKAILGWNQTVEQRVLKMESSWHLALKNLEKPVDRLPSVIPVKIDISDKTLAEWGISSGQRTMEIIEQDGQRSMIRVLPLPIHQDVNNSWLEKVISELEIAVKYSDK
jgi:putative PLP-dependent aminotransferase (TIGR04422 family)